MLLVEDACGERLVLQVVAVSGTGLAVMDASGASDPFVTFKIGLFSAKTTVLGSGLFFC